MAPTSRFLRWVPDPQGVHHCKTDEVQFGLYIAFPIGWMWYFGLNAENRFSVPNFWPKAEATYKIPYEREEIKEELERLRAKRLERRARRLESGLGSKEEDA